MHASEGHHIMCMDIMVILSTLPLQQAWQPVVFVYSVTCNACMRAHGTCLRVTSLCVCRCWCTSHTWALVHWSRSKQHCRGLACRWVVVGWHVLSALSGFVSVQSSLQLIVYKLYVGIKACRKGSWRRLRWYQRSFWQQQHPPEALHVLSY